MAGSVPAARLPRPRAVAVATVWEPQAQSMAPWTDAVGVAPWTLGLKTSVLPLSTVGIPLLAVAATVTVMGQGVAVDIAKPDTYFDVLVDAAAELKAVANAVKPVMPSVWNASLAPPLTDEAAMTASDTLARTV